MKISVSCYENNSLVDVITYVLNENTHKEDPVEVLRVISYNIKNKKINKLKTNWYWDKNGKTIKTPKTIVFGFNN